MFLSRQHFITFAPSSPARPGISLGIEELSPQPMKILIDNGDGTKWMNATGWSCYTCKGQTESDRLADCLYKAAEQILKNQVIRTDYARDGDPDWEENFYILRHSLCPAVLVEQFFMDNKKDLAYLISDEGKRNLIDVIVGGVEKYLS